MGSDLADLVAAAKAGDRSAFDGLVRATYADTFTLAYRLTGNEEDARDVVQDAYLRAFKPGPATRSSTSTPTWPTSAPTTTRRRGPKRRWSATG
jgi:RNA polymerase sigma-70 factor (ECF subfamily)